MKFALLPLILTCIFLDSCDASYKETVVPLYVYKLEAGFYLEVIASEPLLKAPVAMYFGN